MIQFLISLLPASLWIFAIHVLFQEGNLFETQGEWITKKLGEWWSKPIVNCPVCMPSFWGSIFFFVIDYVFDVHLPLRQFIPYIFALCGLNYVINKLLSKERIITDE